MNVGEDGPASLRRSGGSSSEDLADRLQSVMAELSRVQMTMHGAAAPLAAIYVEGARDAVAHALEAVLWTKAAGAKKGRSTDRAPLRLERIGSSPYGIQIASAEPLRIPADSGRAIGSDIASHSSLIAVLREDEVAAAFMAAALSHSDWIHLASDEVFFGDPLAAHAVVATLTGRTSFPLLSRRQLCGLIHRGSADALSDIGWRRLSGPPLPIC